MHTEETSRVLADGGVTQTVAHASVMCTKALKETATRRRVCAAARYKQQAPVYSSPSLLITHVNLCILRNSCHEYSSKIETDSVEMCEG